jgi:hypothetical protein
MFLFRRGPRVDRQPVVHRQPGGRGQVGPDGRRQDVAAQVPVQDEVLRQLSGFWDLSVKVAAVDVDNNKEEKKKEE